ncbi:MAG: hypothetical protein AB7L09_01745 [Nitrospira sp.]
MSETRQQEIVRRAAFLLETLGSEGDTPHTAFLKMLTITIDDQGTTVTFMEDRLGRSLKATTSECHPATQVPYTLFEASRGSTRWWYSRLNGQLLKKLRAMMLLEDLSHV